MCSIDIWIAISRDYSTLLYSITMADLSVLYRMPQYANRLVLRRFDFGNYLKSINGSFLWLFLSFSFSIHVSSWIQYQASVWSE